MNRKLSLADLGMPLMVRGISLADGKLPFKNRGIPLTDCSPPWMALGILLMSLIPHPKSEQVPFKTDGTKLLATTAAVACPISIAICQIKESYHIYIHRRNPMHTVSFAEATRLAAGFHRWSKIYVHVLLWYLLDLKSRQGYFGYKIHN